VSYHEEERKRKGGKESISLCGEIRKGKEKKRIEGIQDFFFFFPLRSMTKRKGAAAGYRPFPSLSHAPGTIEEGEG